MELGVAPMGHREGLLRAIADMQRAQASAGVHAGSHAEAPVLGAAAPSAPPWPYAPQRQRPASAGGSLERARGAGVAGEGFQISADPGAEGPGASVAAARQRMRILHEMDRARVRAALRRMCAQSPFMPGSASWLHPATGVPIVNAYTSRGCQDFACDHHRCGCLHS